MAHVFPGRVKTTDIHPPPVIKLPIEIPPHPRGTTPPDVRPKAPADDAKAPVSDVIGKVADGIDIVGAIVEEATGNGGGGGGGDDAGGGGGGGGRGGGGVEKPAPVSAELELPAAMGSAAARPSPPRRRRSRPAPPRSPPRATATAVAPAATGRDSSASARCAGARWSGAPCASTRCATCAARPKAAPRSAGPPRSCGFPCRGTPRPGRSSASTRARSRSCTAREEGARDRRTTPRGPATRDSAAIRGRKTGAATATCWRGRRPSRRRRRQLMGSSTGPPRRRPTRRWPARGLSQGPRCLLQQRPCLRRWFFGLFFFSLGFAFGSAAARRGLHALAPPPLSHFLSCRWPFLLLISIPLQPSSRTCFIRLYL